MSHPTTALVADAMKSLIKRGFRIVSGHSRLLGTILARIETKNGESNIFDLPTIFLHEKPLDFHYKIPILHELNTCIALMF